MKKGTVVLIVCIVSVVAVAAIIAGVSFAIWRESSVKQAAITAKEQDNPSLRFQVFHALDGDNNLISFQMYNAKDHGNIVRNAYTVDENGERANTLYTYDIIMNEYSIVDFGKVDDDTVFNAENYVAYDPDSASDVEAYGARCYNNETSEGIRLYSEAGVLAEDELVGDTIEWHVLVRGAYMLLSYDSDNGQWYYINTDDETPVNVYCGQIECSCFTKGSNYKKLFYYDGEHYSVATSDQILAGVDLYVEEFATTIYVIDNFKSYNPILQSNVTTYGARYYENETTEGRPLFTNSSGTPANEVSVDSNVTWYVQAAISGASVFAQLSYNSESDYWYYMGTDDEGEPEEVNCGQIICSLYSKTKHHRFFYHDEAEGTYYYASRDQVLEGEDLYIPEYVTYHPTFEKDVQHYGALLYSDKTTGGLLLYHEEDATYQYAEQSEIELRRRIYYTGDEVNYAIATADQLKKGVNLYYKNDDGNQVSATAAQIEAASHVCCGNETAAYALVGYTGTLISEVVVPERVVDESTGKQYVVKKICASPDNAQYAFYRNKIVTSILIPSTIEQISDVTFGDMTNLRDVYFAGVGTITIGDLAFINCENLTNIYLMPGLTLLDGNGDVIDWKSAVFTGCTSMNEYSFKNFQTYVPYNETEEGSGD